MTLLRLNNCRPVRSSVLVKICRGSSMIRPTRYTQGFAQNENACQVPLHYRCFLYLRRQFRVCCDGDFIRSGRALKAMPPEQDVFLRRVQRQSNFGVWSRIGLWGSRAPLPTPAARPARPDRKWQEPRHERPPNFPRWSAVVIQLPAGLPRNMSILVRVHT